MTTHQITTVLGDSPTRSISLVVDVDADKTPFTPTLDWLLLLTAKHALTDVDTAAVFQLRSGAGITATGTAAVCTLSPTATLTAQAGNLYYDIRATHQITGETHIVARGRWQLTRPATRLAIPSMPIYTSLPTSGPDLSLMTGMGAGIKAAMSQDVGTVGSVQIYGSPMAPVSITLPDVTGTVPSLNALGVSGGRLVLGDDTTENGVSVVPWRVSGISQVSLAGQPISGAFTKVFSIPLTAAQMAQGMGYRVMGYVTVEGANYSLNNYTNLRMGWSFLAGSTVIPPPGAISGGNGYWRARNTPPPANFNADSAAGMLQKTRYDVASVMVWLGSSSTATIGFVPGYPVGAVNQQLGDTYPMITYGDGGGTTRGTVTLGACPQAALNSPNELCWMFAINATGAGNYSTNAKLNFNWDLEIHPIL